ncbi:MAG: AMP-binding protein [Candidatus Saccharibacteria bacterium]|nr:AMP-binding protein [Rhodoferax sp.]
MILGDVTERNARCFGNYPAILFEGRTITHGQFFARVRKLIKALATLGFQNQDRVTVLSRNFHEFLEVYRAASPGGFVGLGLHYQISAVGH